METVAVPTLRPDPVAELIDLTDPEDPFQRMKACSVVTYGETTLQRMPWSGLNRPAERGLAAVAHEEAGVRWTVSSRGAPLPGTYERSVFRALEWIAIDGSVAQGAAFENPLVIHPRDLCERLCWRATQPQFDAIEQAMQTLCRVVIEETPAGKPPRRIGLLRSAIPGSQRSVHRSQTCPQFVVYFDKTFVDSINAGHVRPINWGLWIALRDPAAQRVLEILEPEFGVRDGQARASIDVDLLSRLLPLGPGLSRGRRRALLDQAHAALVRRGYLRKVERRVRGASETFVYEPGLTFRAMRYRLESRPALPPFRRSARDAAGAALG
jgi:hypothetical protein